TGVVDRRLRSVHLSIDLPEHDIERSNDRGYVGQHVAATQKIHRLQVRKGGRTDFAFVRLIGAIGNEVDAKLTFRGLNRSVDLTFRNAMTFGVELEMLDQRFHRALHLRASRWNYLVVLEDHRAGTITCA